MDTVYATRASVIQAHRRHKKKKKKKRMGRLDETISIIDLCYDARLVTGEDRRALPRNGYDHTWRLLSRNLTSPWMLDISPTSCDWSPQDAPLIGAS
jgi:hypothetical protein